MDTNVVVNTTAFVLLALLWLGFAAALLFNRDILSKVWLQLHSLPIILQLLIWLLALPVVLGLWIWQTRWPVWLRLALVVGLAWVTLYTFFPRPPLV
jgi:hypothetical protein